MHSEGSRSCSCANKSGRLAVSARFARHGLPLTGLLALVWFLLRVVPKPSRAAYPCQRASLPLISAFVVWLLGSASALFGARLVHRKLRSSLWFVP